VDKALDRVAMGDTVRLLLQGRSGSLSTEAHVEAVDSDNLRVRLNSGTSVTIPASVVVLLEKRMSLEPSIWRRARFPEAIDSIVLPLFALMDGGSPSEGMTLAAEIELAHTVVLDSSARMATPEDSSLIKGMATLFDLLLRRLRAPKYPEAEDLRRNYTENLAELRARCDLVVTSPALGEAISGLCDRVEIAEKAEWEQYTKRFDARPRIVTSGLVTINVDASGEFLLPIRITLDDTYLPAKQVTVSRSPPAERPLRRG
jgi:hypothetical protein